MRSARPLIALIVAACSATPPSSPPPLGGGAGGQVGFADALVVYGDAAGVHGCSAVALTCGAMPAACGAGELLGPNDGKTFSVVPGALVLVAFRCGYIVNHGSGPDLEIWASVPANAQGLVEVSADGTRYVALGTLNGSNQSFSLAVTDLVEARFVRLANVGAAAIAVDAVQAL